MFVVDWHFLVGHLDSFRGPLALPCPFLALPCPFSLLSVLLSEVSDKNRNVYVACLHCVFVTTCPLRRRAQLLRARIMAR